MLSSASRSRARACLITMLVCLGLTAAACGSSSSGSSPSASSSGSSSAALAPFQTNLAADYKGLFTAPPTTAPAHKANQNIWIISCGQASKGCAEPSANAKEAAQALGWKATVFDGNFGVADAYNTGIRQAIAAHANAIITIGIDCDQAKTGYEAAKAAGIIVVGAQSYDCSDKYVHSGTDLLTAQTEFSPKYLTAGATSYERGVAKADWLIVHTDGKAQVINTDFAGLVGGEYENAGFVAEMAKCTTCKIVKTINFTPQDTSNGTLKQEFASALAQYPNANAATNISDGIIIQDDLAQAIQSAGRTKTLALIGGEGYAQDDALIRAQNGQDADMPFDSNWMAWGSVDEVIRAEAGQKSVPEGMGIQAVDATHNMPAVGKDYSAPVDYKADYEKAWGIG
jgi:ribose transport system substrate-binding protein